MLREEGEHHGVEGDGLGGATDAAGGRVAAEDGDGGGVLVAAEEPAFGGVEGEVARGLAAAGDALDEGERAVGGSDAEDDQRVLASVAGVEEVAVERDGDLGGGVFGDGEAGGDGLDGRAGVDQQALGRGARAGCGPEEAVDGGVELVDGVEPAAVGVEGDVARAGAGTVVGEERGRAEAGGGGIDGEDGDAVGAEVVDQQEAVVGREVDGVGVGDVLPGGVGAAMAEAAVLIVDAGYGLGERAAGQDAVGGDGGAVVVGDEGGLAGGVERDVAGAAPAEVTWLMGLSAPVAESMRKLVTEAEASLTALTA